jgi:hypothetical protein
VLSGRTPEKVEIDAQSQADVGNEQISLWHNDNEDAQSLSIVVLRPLLSMIVVVPWTMALPKGAKMLVFLCLSFHGICPTSFIR